MQADHFIGTDFVQGPRGREHGARAKVSSETQSMVCCAVPTLLSFPACFSPMNFVM